MVAYCATSGCTIFDEKLEYLLIPDRAGRREGNKNLVSRRVGDGTGHCQRCWSWKRWPLCFQNGLWNSQAPSVDGRGGVVRMKTVYVNWRWRCWASNGKMVSTLTSCQRKYKLALEMCWIKGARQLLHCASGQFTVAFWWSYQCWIQNTNWRSKQLLTPHNPLFFFYYFFHIFLSALLLRMSCTYVQYMSQQGSKTYSTQVHEHRSI